MNDIKLSFGILKYINKRIKTNKYKYKVNFIDNAPIIDKSENIDLETIKKDVRHFYNVVTSQIRYYNFPYMHRNLKSLKLHPSFIKELRFMKKRVKAYYNCLNNSIIYEKGIKDSVLPHELFHMASTIRKDNDLSIYSGFSQSTNLGDYELIGTGLNEGYTQLLTERYFDVEKKSYPLEKLAALKLEEIIGKENMQIMYFDADLKGLIIKLSNYKDERQIIRFIYAMDDFKNLYCKFNVNTDFYYIKKSYYYVVDFLLDLKFHKIISKSNDLQDAKRQLIIYSNDFKKTFISKKCAIRLIEKEEFDKLFKKYLENLKNYYILKRVDKLKTYSK